MTPEKMARCLEHIVSVMRAAKQPDDIRLSEIQDYLSMAGYDVPLRSYGMHPSDEAMYRAELERVTADNERLRAALEKRYSDWASFESAEAMSVAALRARLGEARALIERSVGSATVAAGSYRRDVAAFLAQEDTPHDTD